MVILDIIFQKQSYKMKNREIEIKNIDKKPGLFASMRNHFLAGLAVAIPVAVTVLLISWLVGKVDGWVKPLIPEQFNPDTYLPFSVPGIGLVISIVIIWMLGVIATNFFGSKLLGLGERILHRVPFVSTIYGTMKQIVTAVTNQKDRAFQEVCLIEYPRKGLYAIGFITKELRGAPSKVLKNGYVCVFVPTTPNPTSGFLLFAKRDDLDILDMTPEEGIKMIISSGMVASSEELEELTEES